MISRWIENAVFWSRWLLAPLYLGLIGVLGVLVYKFGLAFIELIVSVSKESDHNFVLDLLALLDYVLLANLILIVLFSGYENFVSKIEVAEKSVDRPYWMGTVDFSGLKIKLIGSLVAISVIELLKDFIELSTDENAKVGEGLIWRVIIHLTFVVSGVLFAVMDYIADSRASKKGH
ncbi:MAG: TIGR00645 family protein [Micrococcales bacterium]